MAAAMAAPEPAPAAPEIPASAVPRQAPAPTRFHIAQNRDGRWTVGWSDRSADTSFAHLSQAVLFAKRQCRAAAATIELDVGGFFAVVHQAAGWPKSICGGAAEVHAGGGRRA